MSVVPARPRAALTDLAVALATAAAVLMRVRYEFEGNDHQQYLVLPYREIYDGFLLGDWFTWQTTHYHVTFSWIVQAIHALFGEQGFALGMLLAHCVVLAAFGGSVISLARAAGFGRAAALFALVATVFVRSRGLGEAAVTHGVFVPADAALPPFLFACAAFVRGRSLVCGVFLGLAGFLHANYAVLGPLLLGPLELVRGRHDARLALRRVATMAAAYLALALPTLYVIARSFVFPDTEPGATALFFEVRSPHHYDVSSFKLEDVLWPATLAALALPVLTRRDDGPRALLWLLAGMVFWMLLAFVGSKLGVLTIIRLFFWRLSVPFGVLLLVCVGQGLCSAVLERRVAQGPIYLLGSVWLFAYAASSGALQEARPSLLLGIAALALAMGLSIAQRIPDRARAAAVALVAVLLLFASWSGIAGSAPLPLAQAADIATRTQDEVSLREAPRGHYGRLHTWIRDHAPPEARFLAPPGFIDFRLHARRAIFVDWKCTPMRGDELLEWRRRMLLAMGTDDFPVDGYRLRHASTRAYLRHSAQALADLARAEGLTHVIARRWPGAAARAGLSLLKQLGPWRIYELRQVQR